MSMDTKSSLRLLVLATLQAVSAAAFAGDAASGEKLYYEFGCYACHGFNATMRVPLVGGSSGVMANETLFLSYLRLRAEQNPVNPKNTMPNYDASTLTDEQAFDIYAYISSLKDDSPEFEDIPVFVDILESARQEPGNDGNDQ